MTIPAEHPLPAILTQFPQYNRPLGLTAEVVAAASTTNSSLAMIDVGANIGETLAIVESYCPGLYTYLCIEPDAEIAELCRYNFSGNGRVQVEQCFVGENEGANVFLRDDGRANPTTVLTDDGCAEKCYGGGKLVLLDTIAIPFGEGRRICLIKVDTEGYDFSILRSAPNLLKNDKPALFFEWYPDLLSRLKESVWGGFDYLGELGYRYFVLFTSTGDYYCKLIDPDTLLLHSLSLVAASDPSLLYFDVFASTELALCDSLVKKCIQILDTHANPRS